MRSIRERAGVESPLMLISALGLCTSCMMAEESESAETFEAAQAPDTSDPGAHSSQLTAAASDTTGDGIRVAEGVPGWYIYGKRGNIFLSHWDNPPIVGTNSLSGSEYAVRGALPGTNCPNDYGGCPDAWEYNKFDLYISYNNHDVNQQTSGSPLPWMFLPEVHKGELYTWPISIGFTTAWETAELHFESHGIRLIPNMGAQDRTYRLIDQLFPDPITLPHVPIVDDYNWDVPRTPTEVVAVKDPADQTPRAAGTERVQLQKGIALVPLQFVVLYPTDGPYVSGFPRGWVTEEEIEALLDDRWHADKYINNNVGDPSPSSPDNVVSAWTSRAKCDGNYTCRDINQHMPDRIWDQCAKTSPSQYTTESIQFRKVAAFECGVPGDVFHNQATDTTSACKCSDLSCPHAARIRQAVLENCPELVPSTDATLTRGVVDEIAVVYITGQLTDLSQCLNPTYGATDKVKREIFISSGGVTSTGIRSLLSHELGHLFFLNHTDENLASCPDTNLMCKKPLDSHVDLTASQCESAYFYASILHKEFWGADP